MIPQEKTQQQTGLLSWFLSVNRLGDSDIAPKPFKRQPPSSHRLSEIRASILDHINRVGDGEISTPELLDILNIGITQTQLANHIKSLRSYGFVRKTRQVKTYSSIATFYTITERGREAIDRYLTVKTRGETCH